MSDKKVEKEIIVEGDKYIRIFDMVRVTGEALALVEDELKNVSLVELLKDQKEEVNYEEEILTPYNEIANNLKELKDEIKDLNSDLDEAAKKHDDLVDKFNSYENLIKDDDIVEFDEDDEEEVSEE